MTARKQIVHLGVGNFHRAHQAWYTARANAETGEKWSILGVSLRRPDIRDALKPQGFAYTLEIEDVTGTEYEKIDVLGGVIVAKEEPGRVVDAIAAPETAIVTLTVTEKGYSLNPSDRTLNRKDPGIVADLSGSAPVTTIGFLAAGLAARKAAGHAGITIVSCDNLPGNGAVLKAAVIAFAEAGDPELAAWIRDTVGFPSTMVDRIVPATTDELRARVKSATGMDDAWPVATERFTEWVIENSFTGPRPKWEAAGAELVDDVEPYEVRKLRMLNGAHSTLAYAGLLAGKAHVHETMDDEELRTLASAVMTEAADTLPDVVRDTAGEYAATLIRRFSNPGLEHKLIQIAMDGSQKIPVRVLPTLMKRIDADLPAPALQDAIAAWLAFIIETARDEGALNDPLSDMLIASARGVDATMAADALLSLPDVFGTFARAYPDTAKWIGSRAAVYAGG